MDEEENIQSVVSCPTCLGTEHVLIVVSTDPFEIQPWCAKCQDTLGPTVRPTSENFTWLDRHNRQ